MIPDGQHKHGIDGNTPDKKLIMSDLGLKRLSKHLKECKKLPERVTHSPIRFEVAADGKVTLYCGFCSKNLGLCKINDDGIKPRTN
jgi:hypothetical protein